MRKRRKRRVEGVRKGRGGTGGGEGRGGKVDGGGNSDVSSISIYSGSGPTAAAALDGGVDGDGGPTGAHVSCDTG